MAALVSTVRAWESEPFEWGRHDCCLFAARCIDAQTGSRREAELGQCYRDHRSARMFIGSHGGIIPAVSSFLGPLTAGPPRFGDVALVDTIHGPGVGVCIGPTIAVPGDDGLIYYRLEAAKGHWAI